ncbi:hypothetical protein BpHYR1_005954 [Brachionus plicatilis]|uniref:Uncharacterized protein n=1 Tax=Brachionus plicatilis TaxID=10195 RepID=A0A3M7PGN5_BRAPC|nr:hypothetical protein BpHYR1_005954 [Brachionus plicatilis]
MMRALSENSYLPGNWHIDLSVSIINFYILILIALTVTKARSIAHQFSDTNKAQTEFTVRQLGTRNYVAVYLGVD